MVEDHIVRFVPTVAVAAAAADEEENVVVHVGAFAKLIRWLKNPFFKPPPPAQPHPVEIAQSAVIMESPEKQLTNSPMDPCHLQNRTPSQRPITTNEPPPVQTLRFHPIILIIRNQELGKSMLNLAAPLTIGILFSSSGKLSHMLVLEHYVLTGLSIGCVAIFNGIVFRETIPRTASVIEQVGIMTIFVSFNGLLASALPMEFAWVPMLCAGFSLLPFIIAALPRDNYINNDPE